MDFILSPLTRLQLPYSLQILTRQLFKVTFFTFYHLTQKFNISFCRCLGGQSHQYNNITTFFITGNKCMHSTCYTRQEAWCINMSVHLQFYILTFLEQKENAYFCIFVVAFIYSYVLSKASHVNMLLMYLNHQTNAAFLMLNFQYGF